MVVIPLCGTLYVELNANGVASDLVGLSDEDLSLLGIRVQLGEASTGAKPRLTRYPTARSQILFQVVARPHKLDHVNAGRLSIERFVDLTSHGPQRLFGIRGKGRIAAGYDADFTIVDLKREETITNAKVASRAGWTPYDGKRQRLAGRDARARPARDVGWRDNRRRARRTGRLPRRLLTVDRTPTRSLRCDVPS